MIELQVTGMDCQHCVKAVTEAVRGLDPAAKVEIDLPTGRVRAETTATRPALVDAIEAEGYTVAA
ncbi:cation transporter [Roseomonas sp. OT10]|uniref:heavy-metal-associated domain-containing protein n=1 Tax=Roseomonas cutis TaxID=2897332 RepID=UPI001E3BA78E|nr:cation transporter [Roseomonas sp. OT10]UFN47752.1 cation transporter [Roseomonas sp. OT10]